MVGEKRVRRSARDAARETAAHTSFRHRCTYELPPTFIYIHVYSVCFAATKTADLSLPVLRQAESGQAVPGQQATWGYSEPPRIFWVSATLAWAGHFERGVRSIIYPALPM